MITSAAAAAQLKKRDPQDFSLIFSLRSMQYSIVALEFHLFLHSRLGCLTYFRISIFFSFAQFPTQVGKLHIRLIFTYVVVKMVCLKDRYSYNP